MFRTLRLLLVAGLVLAVSIVYGQQDPAAICQAAAKTALDKFKDKGLKEDQFSISLALIDRQGAKSVGGDYRGDEPFYPASVVKLFMLVYAGQLLQDGKLDMSVELDRAARDMIVDSSNDAMGLVMDEISDTTSGPVLNTAEFHEWQHKRNAINRFYLARGYKGVNVNQKTWNEGPYGRERQSLGPNFEYRNVVSANACTKLMTSVALDQAVTGTPQKGKDWPGWIKNYLHRTIPADDPNAGYQSKAFLGGVLPKGSQLWSKAGFTDSSRHDVAWVKLPNGKEFVLSIFTKENSQNQDLIPFIGTCVLAQLGG